MAKRIEIGKRLALLYEGRVLTKHIVVESIGVLRSGKPYAVYGRYLSEGEDAPCKRFDYEYLDFESKDKVNEIVGYEQQVQED